METMVGEHDDGAGGSGPTDRVMLRRWLSIDRRTRKRLEWRLQFGRPVDDPALAGIAAWQGGNQSQNWRRNLTIAPAVFVALLGVEGLRNQFDLRLLLSKGQSSMALYLGLFSLLLGNRIGEARNRLLEYMHLAGSGIQGLATSESPHSSRERWMVRRAVLTGKKVKEPRLSQAALAFARKLKPWLRTLLFLFLIVATTLELLPVVDYFLSRRFVVSSVARFLSALCLIASFLAYLLNRLAEARNELQALDGGPHAVHRE